MVEKQPLSRDLVNSLVNRYIRDHQRVPVLLHIPDNYKLPSDARAGGAEEGSTYFMGLWCEWGAEKLYVSEPPAGWTFPQPKERNT